MWTTIMVILLVLLGLAVLLFALGRKPRDPKVSSSPAKDDPDKPGLFARLFGSKKSTEQKSADRPNWARPVLLFIAFWVVALWFYPSVRDFLWDSAGFWVCVILSALYFLLAFLGRNMKDLRGRPETPVHQILLGWAITILVVVGGGRELVRYTLKRMGASSNVAQATPAQKKATSHAQAAASAPHTEHDSQSVQDSLSKTIVVDYGFLTRLLIPDGYVVDNVNDARVEWQNGETMDGGTVVNFFTREQVSVTVTVRCTRK